MINITTVKKYCSEDISLIENYRLATDDETEMWHCHHRDECKVLPSGMIAIRSKIELIENGRYYNCPANELVFMRNSEHMALHRKFMSSETKEKMSNAKMGKKRGSFSKETREKMSLAHKGSGEIRKGKKFYNDGVRNYFIHPQDALPNYVLGKLETCLKRLARKKSKTYLLSEETRKKLSESIKGRKFYNDGVHNFYIHSDQALPHYKLGRVQKKNNH
jgi:hypothetical protein